MTPIPDGYELLTEANKHRYVDAHNFILNGKFEEGKEWNDIDWKGLRGCFWAKSFDIIVPKKS